MSPITRASAACRRKSSPPTPGRSPSAANIRAILTLVDDAEERAERRRRRPQEWPVRAYRLGEEPSGDPLDRSTVDERIARVWPLTRAAWRVAGKAIPDYARGDAPGVLSRGGTRP
jgi:hypothetical protein